MTPLKQINDAETQLVDAVCSCDADAACRLRAASAVGNVFDSDGQTAPTLCSRHTISAHIRRQFVIRLGTVLAWMAYVAVAAGDDTVTWTNDEFESPAHALRIEQSLRAAAEAVAPAVVALNAADYDASWGTGVVIDPAGLVLTHNHNGPPSKVGDAARVRFPDGRVVKGEYQSVHSEVDRDFAVIRITEPGPYPFVRLPQGETTVKAADFCFHLGYPNAFEPFERSVLKEPLLRFGRISGTGRVSVYANCLIMTGDSGGPLFDMNGRLLGVANYSIGPKLQDPGQWTGIRQLLDGRTWFQPANPEEAVELGFTKRNRTGPDTTRRVSQLPFKTLAEPALRATIQILVDGQPAILGTVVAPNGIVLTKRSEVLNSAGRPIGKLT